MTKKDEDRQDERQNKNDRTDGNKIEWAFKPTLGFQIEPELTKVSFFKFLARLSAPIQEPSGQEIGQFRRNLAHDGLLPRPIWPLTCACTHHAYKLLSCQFLSNVKTLDSHKFK